MKLTMTATVHITDDNGTVSSQSATAEFNTNTGADLKIALKDWEMVTKSLGLEEEDK